MPLGAAWDLRPGLDGYLGHTRHTNIDGLCKKYIDRVGHQCDDAGLRAIAARLQETVRRQGDMVGIYGGEEFIAILPGTDICGAHSVAQSMLRAVQGLEIKHPASPCGCGTLSIGIASMHIVSMHSQRRVDELLVNADRALYSAKAAGRNAASTYLPHLA